MLTGPMVEAREARILNILRDRPEWPTAVARLGELHVQGGATAQEEAARYGQRYAGQRGAMVVDVVASRQRTCLAKVRHIVNGWREEAREPTLAWLAANPPDQARLGLMANEPETLRQVAENLVGFSSSRGLDEDEGCRAWAEETDGLEHAHRLDPVVGGVSGMAPRCSPTCACAAAATRSSRIVEFSGGCGASGSRSRAGSTRSSS
jgi:hypothetical protein